MTTAATNFKAYLLICEQIHVVIIIIIIILTYICTPIKNRQSHYMIIFTPQVPLNALIDISYTLITDIYKYGH